MGKSGYGFQWVHLSPYSVKFSKGLWCHLHQSKYGYDVVCPTLPGCASQGDTEEEALENIKDAIRGYLLAAKKVRRGEKLA